MKEKNSKKQLEIPVKTIRIGKDLNIYEKTKNSWKISNKKFTNAFEVIKLFKAHNQFNQLIDLKDSRFLKGFLLPDGKIRGARINILPNGDILDKAYSIFANNLTVHSESSDNHWDVIYQNPNGKYAYLYSLKDKKKAIRNKFKKVENFEKKYSILNKNVLNSIKNKQDSMAIPMYTLLKTYMRVGNEIYYKADGHKGLTTLKKSDISIKGNQVTFDYKAKDGVPMKITEEFPKDYIKRLNEKIKSLKNSDFIFTDENKKPLKDTSFMNAFEKYCGEKFYPHIVRSFYATKTSEEFLKNHKNKKATKQEVKELFTEIAEKLGHKRFSKKDNEWKDNYNVTIHHYLNPQILDKINSITETKNKTFIKN
ncbi:MAG TPA: hypothetical protein P5277_04480 [Candidatus Paceibacterota bacterium]|nr:hypothetical protein [Candidatus Paceibacterota bacterium]